MPSRMIKYARYLARAKKIWAEYRGKSGQTYVWHRVAQYRDMWRAIANDYGAEFTELAEEIWEISHSGRRTRVQNDILEFDNPVVLDMAGMKPLIYRMLSANNLPVPEYLEFSLDSIESAGEFLSRHPKGCVVKPSNGTSSGQGVTTHILKPREVKKAAILASLYGRHLLIEPMAPGECYRALVLDGEMIHAVCRRGPRLVGDGENSVKELIQAESRKRRKAGQAPFDIDRDCEFTLSYQKLATFTVPEEGQTFIVKSVADPDRKQVEVRTVYNDTVTDRVCGSIREQAIKAAALLGSRFVGVDFITPDCRVPLEETGGIFNELNTTPGLHHHYDSTTEKYPKPALKILEALLS